MKLKVAPNKPSVIVRVVKCVLKKMCNSILPTNTHKALKETRKICNEPIKVTGGCEDDDENEIFSKDNFNLLRPNVKINKIQKREGWHEA